jgi:hypothetical protein
MEAHVAEVVAACQRETGDTGTESKSTW